MGLTREEVEASHELNAIGYLPCEHCGRRVFTMLRDYAEGEKIRLCTDCAAEGPQPPQPGANS